MRRLIAAAVFVVCVAVGVAPATGDAGQKERATQRRPRVPSAPASNVTIESSAQLFATMCALHAAGYDQDVSAAGFHPVRARLRGQLVALQGPATEALREYYREHELADRGATLSRYISFALVAGPPPKFAYTLSHSDLPPDVLTIEGFNDVLVAFYQEAQVERLWRQVQLEYNEEIQRLHGPVLQLVQATGAYLREAPNPASLQTFTVYVEPMVGGKTNFRSFGNHYTIVLNPGSELPADEIRHALIHFYVDRLAFRYRGMILQRQALLNYAARAPRLAPEYKDDFPSLLTECLVRAVELRLRRLAPERLSAAVDEAESDGYVLVRTFVGELANFEKTEPSMTFYFPDMLRGIRVAEESKRLEALRFAPAPVKAEASTAQTSGAEAVPAEDSQLTTWLAEGDRAIALKNGKAATAAFERVLGKYPDEQRALYGLAVASALEGHARRAKELFERLVTGSPPGGNANAAGGTSAAVGAKDPVIVAWSHVYLGRIYDVDGNRELALSEYRAALAVEGVPELARQAAQRGLEKGYERAQQRPRNEDR